MQKQLFSTAEMHWQDASWACINTAIITWQLGKFQGFNVRNFSAMLDANQHLYPCKIEVIRLTTK